MIAQKVQRQEGCGTRVFACGEDSLTLRLTSELVDLRVANANLFFARERAKNKV